MSDTQTRTDSRVVVPDNPADVETRGEAILYMEENGLDELLNLQVMLGVGDELAERLAANGFATLPDIHHEDMDTLLTLEGIDKQTAAGLKAQAARQCDYHFGDYPYTPFMDHNPVAYF